MNRLQLFRTLRRHRKLSAGRSVAYKQNKAARFVGYFFGGFSVLYILFLSIMLSLIANETRTSTPYEFFFCLLPFWLTLDFFVRFLVQQTPSQLIKPYLLLPIPKYACVETFIIISMTSSGNLFWLAMTVPYAYMTILFSNGLWVSLAFIIGFQLIVIINSQSYMLWRTLINQHICWWIAPIVFYALLFLPWLLNDIETLFAFYSTVGEALSLGNPLAWLVVLALLIIFFFINREIQYHFTWKETNGEEHQLKHTSQLYILNRFGITGEYLKLEVRSIQRNKSVRNSFISGAIFTLLQSLFISYTDVYDGLFMSKFWLVYIFVFFGATILVKVMGYEGNYIDGLMVRHENILQLLRAKYLFYSALLIVPFLIMIPAAMAGKYTLLMLLSMLCFTAGPIYCLLMQLAVYNKQTMPLNKKLISQRNIETNWFLAIIEFIVMFAPIFVIFLLLALFSENVAYLIMLFIGVAFIVAHPLWLRNIYRRFMARRYENMESFRATR